MKQLSNYIVSFFKEEVKWSYFYTLIAFASIFIFLQYNYKFSNIFIGQKSGSYFYLRTFLFYSIPFIGTLLLYSTFYKKWELWKNPTFITLTLLTLCIYSYRCGVSWHMDLVKSCVNPLYQSYWIKIASQLSHGLVLFLIPFFWWLVIDKKQISFYGWKFKNVLLKPYFIILLCLIPLVVIAATQKDFLHTYPIGANALKTESGLPKTWMNAVLFELSYSFDFLMNEFFFRGFIILAFAKYLGRSIILPMTIFYVFIHFGKPLGETITSFFGGLALGVIVYETRSIYGGVILHIGIALLMEIAAFIGRAI